MKTKIFSITLGLVFSLGLAFTLPAANAQHHEMGDEKHNEIKKKEHTKEMHTEKKEGQKEMMGKMSGDKKEMMQEMRENIKEKREERKEKTEKQKEKIKKQARRHMKSCIKGGTSEEECKKELKETRKRLLKDFKTMKRDALLEGIRPLKEAKNYCKENHIGEDGKRTPEFRKCIVEEFVPAIKEFNKSRKEIGTQARELRKECKESLGEEADPFEIDVCAMNALKEVRMKEEPNESEDVKAITNDETTEEAFGDEESEENEEKSDEEDAEDREENEEGEESDESEESEENSETEKEEDEANTDSHEENESEDNDDDENDSETEGGSATTE